MEVGRSAQCCEGCSAACSRVVVPRFAGGAECAELCRLADAVMEADLGDTVITQLSLASAAYHGGPRLTLLMVRLVEKLRRAVAYEYGLPLASVAPHTAMVSRWGPEHGGCADGTPVHGDEAACDGFHYSSIVHLDSQGELGPDGEIIGDGDFAGGDFVFSDVATAASVAAAASAPLADARVEIGNGKHGKGPSGRTLTPTLTLTLALTLTLSPHPNQARARTGDCSRASRRSEGARRSSRRAGRTCTSSTPSPPAGGSPCPPSSSRTRRRPARAKATCEAPWGGR